MWRDQRELPGEVLPVEEEVLLEVPGESEKDERKELPYVRSWKVLEQELLFLWLNVYVYLDPLGLKVVTND